MADQDPYILGRIQLRNGTKQELIARNEVLLSGELCIESFTKMKIGDGVTPYNELNYVGNPLFGTNYLMVYGTGTPAENAAELQAAYNEAKKMPRYLGILSSNTPIQMYAGQTFGIYTGSYIYYKILVDGTYNPFNFSSSVRVTVTESEAKSTRATVIVAPGEYNFGTSAFEVDTSGINIISLTGKKDVLINSINVSTNYVYVSGINCGTGKFDVSSGLPNIIIENCEGGNYSFCGEGGNVASGTFNYCTGGDYSFGGAGGNVSGTFNNCIGGNYSFGGSGGSITGALINCKLTSGTFKTPIGAGKIYNCIDGNGNLVNYPEVGSNLNGTNYLMVYGIGTPEENAAELQAAYNEAKKMPRYLGVYDDTAQPPEILYEGQTYKSYGDGLYYKVESNLSVISISEAQAKSVRTTVIVAPGEYNFGASAFVVNEPGINIVSLTGNSDVIISSTEQNSVYNYVYGIKVIADYILIKGINCKTNTFYIESYLNNLICEYCIGGNKSFGIVSSGTFNHCIGGNYSFGSGYGTKGTASGTFNYCIGGEASFGSDGTASGTFTNCKGAAASFGSYGGTISGTFNNCIGGSNSFGMYGGTIEASARLYYTRLTSGTFPTPITGGRLILCIDGNNNIVTI